MNYNNNVIDGWPWIAVKTILSVNYIDAGNGSAAKILDPEIFSFAPSSCFCLLKNFNSN